MRLISVEHLEDCFDGSAVFRYQTDEPWTTERICALRQIGTLDYFPDFPRPFYRARTPQGLEIKGLQGERVCRVVLPKAGRELLRQRWEELLADSPDGP
ncbi:MAG TPA: hypothetical protein VLY24_21040 [Bryobacteraceae bacterium]|nr:hypothetical protein [Bryobacteraceae bacterium]